jgi:membrane protein YqaA with SNARE-associated domain
LDVFPPGTIDDLRDGRLDEESANRITMILVASGAAFWLLGLIALWHAERSAVPPWNAVWGVAGVSFLGSFAIPLPGTTTAIFAALRTSPLLASAAVLGATFGGSLSAAILLQAGDLLRDKLERKAKKGRFANSFLKWAKKLVGRWTYVAIVGLLALPFMPRAPVLYAASLIEARFLPVIGAIALGHFLRFSIFMLMLSQF